MNKLPKVSILMPSYNRNNFLGLILNNILNQTYPHELLELVIIDDGSKKLITDEKLVREKIFPGYILVNMIVTDDSWYVVRNTPNVTGFVGSGTTPTPVSEEEVKELKRRMGVEEPTYKVDVSVGSPVKIVDGPFKDLEGKVSNVDESKGKVKVLVSMFGRETPVELDFLQIKKI